MSAAILQELQTAITDVEGVTSTIQTVTADVSKYKDTVKDVVIAYGVLFVLLFLMQIIILIIVMVKK